MKRKNNQFEGDYLSTRTIKIRKNTSSLAYILKDIKKQKNDQIKETSICFSSG